MLHVLSRKRVDAKLVIMVDSKCVYVGLTEDVLRRERDGWRTSAGMVAHCDLWTQFLAQLRRHEITACFSWVSSHVGLGSNEGAHPLAEEGRLHPPCNEEGRAKRCSP